MNVLPDPFRTAKAFADLNLLMVVDPYPTETSRLGHYVLAPSLALERADHTRPYERTYSTPYAQYAEPVLARPAGVLDDREYFARLAHAMGNPFRLGAHVIAPDEQLPDTQTVLQWMADKGRVPLSEVRRYPGGHIFGDLQPVLVRSADDVAAELQAAVDTSDGAQDCPFTLVVRRQMSTMNSLGRSMPELNAPHNACHAHSADLAELAMAEGEVIRISSRHGELRVSVVADNTLPRGVVALCHGYGALPGHDLEDALRFGANPNQLVAATAELQDINAMPRFSAVPIRLEQASFSPASGAGAGL